MKQNDKQTALANEDKRAADKRNFLGKDITLNVNLGGGFIRIGLAILLLLLLIILPNRADWVVATVCFCLLVSRLTHFCLLKYTWQRLILKQPAPDRCELSKELNIPVDEI